MKRRGRIGGVFMVSRRVLVALTAALGLAALPRPGAAGVNQGSTGAPGQGPKPVAPIAGQGLPLAGKGDIGSPTQAAIPAAPESLTVPVIPGLQNPKEEPPAPPTARPAVEPVPRPMGLPAPGVSGAGVPPPTEIGRGLPAGNPPALDGQAAGASLGSAQAKGGSGSAPRDGRSAFPEGSGDSPPGENAAPDSETQAWLDRVFDGKGSSPLGDSLAVPELELDAPPAELSPALSTTEEEPGGSQAERLARLKGKRLVVVSAGYSGKRFIFERARELGVEAVLLGEPQDLWAKDLVSEFVPIGSVVPEKGYAEARDKLKALSSSGGPLQGLVTFWEDSVPLAGYLAKQMGLPFHTVAGALAARNKFAGRKLMLQKGIPSPRFALLTGAEENLEASMKWVGFPAVIKPLYGATAVFVRRVNSPEEAREIYARLSSEISPAAESALHHGTQLMLEQYIPGREFDLDLKMQRGRNVFDSLTYNWPTRRRDFKSTGASLPGAAFAPEEAARIRKEGVGLALAMGLVHGIIHLEGILGDDGVVYFIDPNGRMGGVYVRDWVKEVWGVDLVDEQLLLGADIPSTPAKPEKPLAYLEGEFLFAPRSGVLRGIRLSRKAAANPGIKLRVLEQPGARVKEGDSRIAMITFSGKTQDQALSLLELHRSTRDDWAKRLVEIEIEP